MGRVNSGESSPLDDCCHRCREVHRKQVAHCRTGRPSQVLQKQSDPRPSMAATPLATLGSGRTRSASHDSTIAATCCSDINTPLNNNGGCNFAPVSMLVIAKHPNFGPSPSPLACCNLRHSQLLTRMHMTYVSQCHKDRPPVLHATVPGLLLRSWEMRRATRPGDIDAAYTP